jgi:hypothetical protein
VLVLCDTIRLTLADRLLAKAELLPAAGVTGL